MPLGVLLLLATLVGLLIGVVALHAMTRADRRRTPRTLPAPREVMAPGTSEVLSILSSAYVVLDTSGDVRRASPLAYSYGIVRATGGDSPRLADTRLVELVTDIGRHGGLHDDRMTLPLSPEGDTEAVLHVRIASIGSHGVLLLADDLTREVRVEATRRDFVANVSHELKTPVGAITLLAETMEDAAEDPDAVRRFASRMQTESRRLSHLVQEIIELSRVQGTSALTDAEPVDIAGVVQDAVALNHTLAAGRSITITVDDAPGLQVFGSAAMLTTAVSNLISNAVLYSEPGTRIDVGLRDADGMVEISVHDQGSGISREHLERVFERFFRVDSARSRRTGGTGLGLAIVKHIVTDHGGEVSASSREGDGSTFTIRLPAMGSTDTLPVDDASAPIPEET